MLLSYSVYPVSTSVLQAKIGAKAKIIGTRERLIEQVQRTLEQVP